MRCFQADCDLNPVRYLDGPLPELEPDAAVVRVVSSPAERPQKSGGDRGFSPSAAQGPDGVPSWLVDTWAADRLVTEGHRLLAK